MSNSKDSVSPLVKTLARRISAEEMQSVSGGVNSGTSVTLSKRSIDEFSYHPDGSLAGIDTVSY